MSREITAAVVQLCARQDVDQNLSTAANLVERAASQGAQVVVLPENFAYIRSLKDKLALAEPLSQETPGPIVGAMMEVARQQGVFLVLGGTPIQSPRADRFYTTAILLDPEGHIQASYRKIHLFDINIPRGAVFTESDWVEPGQDVVTAPLLGCTLGFSICYDLRFPELYRELVQKGADLLCAPAAFTLHTGKDHWFALLRARAIENQCYVLAAAQHGWHTDSRATFGKSCIVDPWGAVLAQCPDIDSVAVATLDLDYLSRVRQELPCLEHRRL